LSGTNGTPAHALANSATGSAGLLTSSTAARCAPEARISAAAAPAAANSSA
jgi:hypothetical protein